MFILNYSDHVIVYKYKYVYSNIIFTHIFARDSDQNPYLFSGTVYLSFHTASH